MWFGEEDVLDSMLLKPLGDQQLVSLTLKEEITLLSDHQEAYVAAVHPPRYKK